MELHLNKGAGPLIQSYDNGEFQVDNTLYANSLLIQAEKNVEVWKPNSLAELKSEDIQCLLSYQSTIILLGTGDTLCYPDEELLRELYASERGVELMDTAAACRTYNVLMSESRDVVAALLRY